MRTARRAGTLTHTASGALEKKKKLTVKESSPLKLPFVSLFDYQEPQVANCCGGTVQFFL